MRTALPPFVNQFEAWMPPETRCVGALCPKRGAMAGVWLGWEGGEGVGRGSHNARAFYAHDERARETGGTDVDSSADCTLACAHESDALTMRCALGCRPRQADNSDSGS